MKQLDNTDIGVQHNTYTWNANIITSINEML